jgi:nucleotide-binding universal stress UspA family protein
MCIRRTGNEWTRGVKMSRPDATEDILMPVSANLEYSDMVAALLPLLRFQTTSITLFHVIETPMSTPLEHNALDELKLAAENDLRPLREWLENQGYHLKTKIVVARHASEAIIEEANTSHYSLIFMMKRRKRRGHQILPRRSVTESVIRDAECPVISVLV